jgi:hypothetical protein
LEEVGIRIHDGVLDGVSVEECDHFGKHLKLVDGGLTLLTG